MCYFQTIIGCLSVFPRFLDYGLFAALFLRLGLGSVFIAHGYPKLFSRKMSDGSRRGGLAQTAAWFASINIKPAKFWAIVVGVVEFFGGILLIVGLGVQLVALLLAVNLVVAIGKVKYAKGFVGGWEFDLALLLMALALLVLGGGAYSLDLPF